MYFNSSVILCTQLKCVFPACLNKVSHLTNYEKKKQLPSLQTSTTMLFASWLLEDNMTSTVCSQNLWISKDNNTWLL